MSKFDWKVLDRNYEDVIYETYNGIAKITINRPEVRNAFRPKTVMELIDAFTVAREDNEVGVIVLTGANHGKGEDKEAFCSGGDQSVRGHGGYVGEDNVPRLNVLDLQRLIRVIPNLLLQWLMVMLSVAVMYCTSYVTLQSLLKMLSSVKLVLV